jgi:hypothetical protein
VLQQTKNVLGAEFTLFSPTTPGFDGGFETDSHNASSTSLAAKSETPLEKKSADSIGVEEKEEADANSAGVARHRLNRRASFSAVVKDVRQRSFMEVLRREFTKVDNFCRKEIKRLSDKVSAVGTEVKFWALLVSKVEIFVFFSLQILTRNRMNWEKFQIKLK